MDKLFCIRSTNCLRLKRTRIYKGTMYYYKKFQMKKNGEVYVWDKSCLKNSKWGYLGIYDIKYFMNEKEYNEYKKREDLINKLINE